MAFTANTIEHLIESAIRNQGVNLLSQVENFEAFDRYADFIARMHQKAFDAMDYPIDLQNMAMLQEEFDMETSYFMQSMGAAQDVNGEDVSFANLFGGERIGRPEYLIYLAAKFIIMFTATWKTLNLTQNAIGDSTELKAKLMRFRERDVASMI